MLEIKNLVKVYKTKGGVETRALDDVSVLFPETGLVFLLGKSGSGKSTLLNMIGGLDRPDKGEVIVKGRSSKNFSQADFDSYRNTFIGFIFQEYNILNEFNVEQNIALALQLQGKKNDRDAVNALLKEVDLYGFNKRKPNTLSGGQKQRIAIARALIKNPDIIMADEPTGALDSVTGKQVLDTLKKLSKKKLVIIVSHDQDFAEEYGDRIIELKDGKIISDKTKQQIPPKVVSGNIQIVNGTTIDIKKGSNLSEAEFRQIYQLLKKQDKEILISTGEQSIALTKKAQRISSNNSGETFSNTTSNDVVIKKYDGGKTKFIRSHLPFARGFKMGASGLKSKPIRLIFTILISVVSFTMFGVASTLMFYDPSYSISKALEGSSKHQEALMKQYDGESSYNKFNPKTGEVKKESSYTNTYSTLFGKQEIKELDNGRNKVAGVFSLKLPNEWDSSSGLNFAGISVNKDPYTTYYKYSSLLGFSDAGKNFVTSNGNFVAGDYPTSDDEIAISEYHYNLIKESGHFSGVNTPEDLINKSISINSSYSKGGEGLTFKVSGIFHFENIASEFDELKNPSSTITPEERGVLEKRYDDYITKSFHTVGFVTPSWLDKNFFVPSESYRWNNSYELKGVSYFESRKDAEAQEVSPENTNYVYINEYLKYGNPDAIQYYDLDYNKTGKIDISIDEVILPFGNYYSNYKRHKYSWPIELDRSRLYQIDRYSSDLRGFTQSYDSDDYHFGKAIQNIENFVNAWDMFDDSSIQEDVNYIKDNLPTVVNKALNISYLSSAFGYVYSYSNNFGVTLPEGLDKALEISGRIDNWESVSEDELNTFKDYIIEALSTAEYASVKDYLLTLTTAETFYDIASEEVRFELNVFANKAGYGDYLNWLNNAVYEIGGPNEIHISIIRNSFATSYEDVYGEAPDYTFNPNSIKYYALEVKPIEKLTKVYLKDFSGTITEATVKGYAMDTNNYSYYPIFAYENVRNFITTTESSFNTITTDYVAPEDVRYSYAVVVTNYTQEDINFMTKKTDTYQYKMTNNIYRQVSTYTDLIAQLKDIFLIIGAATGGLCALLLLNFISVSISTKKKDIGILRAVGARGSDVFKIFFSESSVIALICFILSSVATGVVCYFLNKTFKESIIAMSLLDFGVINVAMILGVTLIITFVATIIPVSINAKKPPVEAIRSL